MNAEKWHENTTESERLPSTKGELPPSLFSVWARGIESAEIDARRQQAESDPGETPRPAADEEPESQEMRATLLRAIESTELAARLQRDEPEGGRRAQDVQGEQPSSQETLNVLLRALENREPAGNPQAMAPRTAQPDAPLPHEPPARPLPPEAPPSEPAARDAALPFSAIPMAIPPWERRGNRSLSATSPPVAASSAVQQRRLPPDHPLVLMPAPQPGPAAPETSQGGARANPPASVEDQSPLIARLTDEIRSLAPKVGPSTRALLNSAEERLSQWLQSWLALPPPGDPRGSPRLLKPPLVAYYWTGGTPKPQAVLDISSTGLFLVTHDRWHPGTGISMALQRTDQERGTPGYWIAVNVMVIRQADNGFGGIFIPCLPGLADNARRRAANRADKETLEQFIKQLAASTQR